VDIAPFYQILSVLERIASAMSEQNENVTPGKVEMSPLSKKPLNLEY